MNNFIEFNKFSHLHNDKNIFFCKTDYAFSFFKEISGLKSKLTLIIGNSDRSIDDSHALALPSNVIKVYGQNVITQDSRFEALPMGLENSTESFIGKKHGIAWPRSKTLQKHLLDFKDFHPSKFVYSNFRCGTNRHHRSQVDALSQQVDFITRDAPNLSTTEFHNRILDHKITLCPAGNGVDTHRLWEVLYLNRIPLTIKMGDYKIYELYKHLPIIILDCIEDLFDKDLIQEKYNKSILNKTTMAYFSFWRNKILTCI